MLREKVDRGWHESYRMLSRSTSSTRSSQAWCIDLLWRRQLGMTQYQLADKSGLAQSYISDLESGAVDPRWSTIYRVVYGLGEMNIQDFLNGPQTIRSLKIH